MIDWIKRLFRKTPTERQLAFIRRSGANACCKVRENLTRVDVTKTSAKNTCRVCGRNHYYMQADPIRVGVQ
jgi:hypothetical protein